MLEMDRGGFLRGGMGPGAAPLSQALTFPGWGSFVPAWGVGTEVVPLGGAQHRWCSRSPPRSWGPGARWC